MQKSQQTLRVEDVQGVSEVVSVLAHSHSIVMLQEIYAQGWSSASELARNLGIHVATAMRKLSELESANLVKRRVRQASRVVEYGLASSRLEIVLDFESEKKKAEEGVAKHAEGIFVRERTDGSVMAEADKQLRRILRLVFIEGKGWRTPTKTMELTELEGRFLWHLPYGSESARSVADICRQADIKDVLQIARILDFVREMKKLGVVEVVR